MPKPYKQQMSKTWWLDHPAYRLFMLRELSGVFIAVYFLVLVNVMSKAGEPEALAECLASLRTWPWYLFHGVILVFSLLHTVTWLTWPQKRSSFHLERIVYLGSLLPVLIIWAWERSR